jgi:hypothetical protein
MHRAQDYFSHYGKGYVWDPSLYNKDLGLGHLFSGTEPDEDMKAWHYANKFTEKWVDKWRAQWGEECGCP